jgi:hypothetical protein
MFWIGSSRVQDLPLLRLIFSRALLSRGAVFGFRPVGHESSLPLRQVMGNQAGQAQGAAQ